MPVSRAPSSITFLLAGAALLLLAAAPLYAQAGIFWSPPSVNLSVPSGGTGAFRCDLVNTGGKTSLFRVAVAPVGQRDDGSYFFPRPDEGGGAPSCAEWIVPEPTELVLQAGESAAVMCSVQVPRGIRSGGYYAAVLCQLVPDEVAEEEGLIARMSIQLNAATIVMLDTSRRTPRPRAKLARLVVEPGEEGGLWFKGALQNLGDIHVFGKGQLILRSARGRRLAATQLGAGRGTVLPRTTVDFATLVQQPLPMGEYIAEARIDYGGRSPAIAQTPFTVGRQMVLGAATEGLALSSEPGMLYAELPPGAVRVQKLAFMNLEDRQVDVRLHVADLVQNSVGELAPAEEGEVPAPAAADMISFRLDEFSLPAGGRRTIPVTLSVPADAEPGGRYASIVAEAAAVSPSGGPANSTIFSSLLLTVRGECETQAEVAALDLVSARPEGPYVFQAEIRNPSALHVHLQRLVVTVTPRTDEGSADLAAGAKRLVTDLTGDVLLPGARRLLEIRFDEPFDPARYSVRATAAYDVPGVQGRLLAEATTEFEIPRDET